MENNDKELLVLLQKNPEKGICRIMDVYGAAVKTICSHILRVCGQDLVEDAIQESFFRLWKNVSDGKIIKRNLKAYLYQIARNCAIDSLRNYQRQQCQSIEDFPYEGIEELVWETAADVEQEFARKHNYQLVHDVIREMEEPNRSIFILRFFYNYSVKEIAEQVHLNQDNVESRIRRDKKRLQEKLIERGVLYDA